MVLHNTLTNLNRTNWQKEDNWENFSIQSGATGLRFSLAGLPPEEIDRFKEKLSELGVKFVQKTATVSGAKVLAGDETIRILDPDSLGKLKSGIFEKAENSASFWESWENKTGPYLGKMEETAEEKETKKAKEFWEKYDRDSKIRKAEGGVYISPWDAFVNKLSTEDSDTYAMALFEGAHIRAQNANYKDPKGKSLHSDEWTDEEGNSLLTYVVQRNQEKLAKLLVSQYYSNVRHANKFGFTPLHAAARVGSQSMCEWLIDKGANPLAKTNGQTPSELAKANKHTDVATYLGKEEVKRSFYTGKSSLFDR